MATLKLQHLYESTKADFLAVANAANVDLAELANEAVKSGKYPAKTLWCIFNEIVSQKQFDDSHPTWTHRKAIGANAIQRCIPFISPNWQSETIYSIADDSHTESLLKRVFVSFANPDIA